MFGPEMTQEMISNLKILSFLVSKELLLGTVPVSFYRSSISQKCLWTDILFLFLKVQKNRKEFWWCRRFSNFLFSSRDQELDLGSGLCLRKTENLLYWPFKIFLCLPLSNLDQELDLGSSLLFWQSENLLAE
jgi:hypothetical protein